MKKPSQKICAVEGCKNAASVRLYCKEHNNDAFLRNEESLPKENVGYVFYFIAAAKENISRIEVLSDSTLNKWNINIEDPLRSLKLFFRLGDNQIWRSSVIPSSFASSAASCIEYKFRFKRNVSIPEVKKSWRDSAMDFVADPVDSVKNLINGGDGTDKDAYKWQWEWPGGKESNRVWKYDPSETIRFIPGLYGSKDNNFIFNSYDHIFYDMIETDCSDELKSECHDIISNIKFDSGLRHQGAEKSSHLKTLHQISIMTRLKGTNLSAVLSSFNSTKPLPNIPKVSEHIQSIIELLVGGNVTETNSFQTLNVFLSIVELADSGRKGMNSVITFISDESLFLNNMTKAFNESGFSNETKISDEDISMTIRLSQRVKGNHKTPLLPSIVDKLCLFFISIVSDPFDNARILNALVDNKSNDFSQLITKSRDTLSKNLVKVKSTKELDSFFTFYGIHYLVDKNLIRRHYTNLFCDTFSSSHVNDFVDVPVSVKLLALKGDEISKIITCALSANFNSYTVNLICFLMEESSNAFDFVEDCLKFVKKYSNNNSNSYGDLISSMNDIVKLSFCFGNDNNKAIVKRKFDDVLTSLLNSEIQKNSNNIDSLMKLYIAVIDDDFSGNLQKLMEVSFSSWGGKRDCKQMTPILFSNRFNQKLGSSLEKLLKYLVCKVLSNDLIGIDIKYLISNHQLWSIIFKGKYLDDCQPAIAGRKCLSSFHDNVKNLSITIRILEICHQNSKCISDLVSCALNSRLDLTKVNFLFSVFMTEYNELNLIISTISRYQADSEMKKWLADILGSDYFNYTILEISNSSLWNRIDVTPIVSFPVDVLLKLAKAFASFQKSFCFQNYCAFSLNCLGCNNVKTTEVMKKIHSLTERSIEMARKLRLPVGEENTFPLGDARVLIGDIAEDSLETELETFILVADRSNSRYLKPHSSWINVLKQISSVSNSFNVGNAVLKSLNICGFRELDDHNYVSLKSFAKLIDSLKEDVSIFDIASGIESGIQQVKDLNFSTEAKKILAELSDKGKLVDFIRKRKDVSSDLMVQSVENKSSNMNHELINSFVSCHKFIKRLLPINEAKSFADCIQILKKSINVIPVEAIRLLVDQLHTCTDFIPQINKMLSAVLEKAEQTRNLVQFCAKDSTLEFSVSYSDNDKAVKCSPKISLTCNLLDGVSCMENDDLKEFWSRILIVCGRYSTSNVGGDEDDKKILSEKKSLEESAEYLSKVLEPAIGVLQDLAEIILLGHLNFRPGWKKAIKLSKNKNTDLIYCCPQLYDLRLNLQQELVEWKRCLEDARRDSYALSCIPAVRLSSFSSDLQRNSINVANIVNLINLSTSSNFLSTTAKTSFSTKSGYVSLKDELEKFGSFFQDMPPPLPFLIPDKSYSIALKSYRNVKIDCGIQLFYSQRRSETPLALLLVYFLHKQMPLPHCSLVGTKHTTLEEVDLLLSRCLFISKLPREQYTLFSILDVDKMPSKVQCHLGEWVQRQRRILEEQTIKKEVYGVFLALFCCNDSQQSPIRGYFHLPEDIGLINLKIIKEVLTDVSKQGSDSKHGAFSYLPFDSVLTVSSNESGNGKSTFIQSIMMENNHLKNHGVILVGGSRSQHDIASTFRNNLNSKINSLHIDLAPFHETTGICVNSMLFEILLLGMIQDPGEGLPLFTRPAVLNTSGLVNKFPKLNLYFEIKNNHRNSFVDETSLLSVLPGNEKNTGYFRRFGNISELIPLPSNDELIYLRQFAKFSCAVATKSNKFDVEDMPDADIAAELNRTFGINELIRKNKTINLRSITNAAKFIAITMLNLPLSVLFVVLENNEKILMRESAFHISKRQIERGEADIRQFLTQDRVSNFLVDEVDSALAFRKSLSPWESFNELTLAIVGDAKTTAVMVPLTPNAAAVNAVPTVIKDLIQVACKVLKISEKDNPYQIVDLSRCEVDQWRKKLEFLLNNNDIDSRRIAGDRILQGYALTKDNFLKLLNIHSRLEVRIPVIIMGASGCGKTKLMEAMSALCGWNFLPPLSINAGTTESVIKQFVQDGIKVASNTKNKVVLFFDECNTCDHLDFLTQIICDSHLDGKKLPSNLLCVSACNPYELRNEDEMEANGFSVMERKGRDSLSKLRYRVHPLPHSMLEFVIDFGSINNVDLSNYISQMIDSSINSLRLNDLTDRNHRKIVELIVTKKHFRDGILKAVYSAQTLSSSGLGYGFPTSLRDVRRFLEIFNWFLTNLFKFKQCYDVDDYFRKLVCISIHLGYIVRVSSLNKRNLIVEHIVGSMSLSARTFLEVVEEVENSITKEFKLAPDVALNRAMRENLLASFVCILLKIPIIICGQPGCSKSLAVTTLFSNLRENSLKDGVFKFIPDAIRYVFQGSKQSTSNGVDEIFIQTIKYQESAGDETLFVVLFDEIGVSEFSPDNPLKVLHSRLEPTNVKEKVSFIGLSNWSLDVAKMSRVLILSCCAPDKNDLMKTANLILKDTGGGFDNNLNNNLDQVVTAYLEYYDKQQFNSNTRGFHGLRDFYSLIKFIVKFWNSQKSLLKAGRSSTGKKLEIFGIYIPFPSGLSIGEITLIGIHQNFGGRPSASSIEMSPNSSSIHGQSDVNPIEIFKSVDSVKKSLLSHEIALKPLDIIRSLLADSDGRHIMILTDCSDFCVNALQSVDFESLKETKLMIESDFSEDQTVTSDTRIVNDVMFTMETGVPIILLNHTRTFEAFYDLLNQRYEIMDKLKFCRVAMGSINRSHCPVHPNFRVIAIADRVIAYKNYDSALLNRFAKVDFSLDAMLNATQLEFANQIWDWVEKHCHEGSFSTHDYIPGFYKQTASSLSFALTNGIIDTKKLSISNDLFQQAIDIVSNSICLDAKVRISYKNKSLLSLGGSFFTFKSLVEHLLSTDNLGKLPVNLVNVTTFSDLSDDFSLNGLFEKKSIIDLNTIISEVDLKNRIASHCEDIIKIAKPSILIVKASAITCNPHRLMLVRSRMQEAVIAFFQNNNDRKLSSKNLFVLLVSFPRIPRCLYVMPPFEDRNTSNPYWNHHFVDVLSSTLPFDLNVLALTEESLITAVSFSSQISIFNEISECSETLLNIIDESVLLISVKIESSNLHSVVESLLRILEAPHSRKMFGTLVLHQLQKLSGSCVNKKEWQYKVSKDSELLASNSVYIYALIEYAQNIVVTEAAKIISKALKVNSFYSLDNASSNLDNRRYSDCLVLFWTESMLRSLDIPTADEGLSRSLKCKHNIKLLFPWSFTFWSDIVDVCEEFLIGSPKVISVNSKMSYIRDQVIFYLKTPQTVFVRLNKVQEFVKSIDDNLFYNDICHITAINLGLIQNFSSDEDAEENTQEIIKVVKMFFECLIRSADDHLNFISSVFALSTVRKNSLTQLVPFIFKFKSWFQNYEYSSLPISYLGFNNWFHIFAVFLKVHSPDENVSVSSRLCDSLQTFALDYVENQLNRIKESRKMSDSTDALSNIEILEIKNSIFEFFEICSIHLEKYIQNEILDSEIHCDGEGEHVSEFCLRFVQSSYICNNIFAILEQNLVSVEVELIYNVLKTLLSESWTSDTRVCSRACSIIFDHESLDSNVKVEIIENLIEKFVIFNGNSGSHLQSDVDVAKTKCPDILIKEYFLLLDVALSLIKTAPQKSNFEKKFSNSLYVALLGNLFNSCDSLLDFRLNLDKFIFDDILSKTVERQGVDCLLLNCLVTSVSSLPPLQQMFHADENIEIKVFNEAVQYYIFTLKHGKFEGSWVKKASSISILRMTSLNLSLIMENILLHTKPIDYNQKETMRIWCSLLSHKSVPINQLFPTISDAVVSPHLFMVLKILFEKHGISRIAKICKNAENILSDKFFHELSSQLTIISGSFPPPSIEYNPMCYVDADSVNTRNIFTSGLNNMRSKRTKEELEMALNTNNCVTGAIDFVFEKLYAPRSIFEDCDSNDEWKQIHNIVQTTLSARKSNVNFFLKSLSNNTFSTSEFQNGNLLLQLSVNDINYELKTIILHFIKLMLTGPQDDPFFSLFSSSSSLKSNYLPSMPFDNTKYLLMVGGITSIWQCSCGFRYGIGDCGMPTQIGSCPGCKRAIGGASYNAVAAGQTRAIKSSSDPIGYTASTRRSKELDHRLKNFLKSGECNIKTDEKEDNDRQFSDVCFHVQRFILHVGLWSSGLLKIISTNDMQSVLRTSGSDEDCWDFICAEIIREWQTIIGFCKGPRKAFILIHSCLHEYKSNSILTSFSFTTTLGREQWEQWFNSNCFQKIHSDLDFAESYFTAPRKVLIREGETEVPLELFLSEKAPSLEEITNISKYNSDRIMYHCFRRYENGMSFSLPEILRKVDKTAYPFLSEIENLKPALSELSNFWAIIQWQHLIKNKQMSDKLNKSYFYRTTNKVFIDEEERKGDRTIRSYFNSFCTSWNSVRSSIDMYGCQSWLIPIMSLKQPLILSCVEENGNSMCNSIIMPNSSFSFSESNRSELYNPGRHLLLIIRRLTTIHNTTLFALVLSAAKSSSCRSLTYHASRHFDRAATILSTQLVDSNSDDAMLNTDCSISDVCDDLLHIDQCKEVNLIAFSSNYERFVSQLNILNFSLLFGSSSKSSMNPSGLEKLLVNKMMRGASFLRFDGNDTVFLFSDHQRLFSVVRDVEIKFMNTLVPCNSKVFQDMSAILQNVKYSLHLHRILEYTMTLMLKGQPELHSSLINFLSYGGLIKNSSDLHFVRGSNLKDIQVANIVSLYYHVEDIVADALLPRVHEQYRCPIVSKLDKDQIESSIKEFQSQSFIFDMFVKFFRRFLIRKLWADDYNTSISILDAVVVEIENSNPSNDEESKLNDQLVDIFQKPSNGILICAKSLNLSISLETYIYYSNWKKTVIATSNLNSNNDIYNNNINNNLDNKNKNSSNNSNNNNVISTTRKVIIESGKEDDDPLFSTQFALAEYQFNKDMAA